MAKAHGRRKGTEAAVELRRLLTKVSVAIWRRAARMVRACTPAAMDDEDEDGAEAVLAETVARRGHPGTAEVLSTELA